jgi:hypothetical protein
VTIASISLAVCITAQLGVVGELSKPDITDSVSAFSTTPAPATNPFILSSAAGTELRRTDRFEYQSARVGLNIRF